MFSLTVIIALLASAHGFVRPRPPMLDGRIVGGKPATIQEAPYQVALLLDYWGTGDFNQACGGSIIKTNVILTAAHCTEETYPYQWKIRAGSTYHNSGGYVEDVEKFLQHSSFTAAMDYDICLMHLFTPLTITSGVGIVPLPFQGQVVQDGALALITGWGAFSEGGSAPTQLQKVTLPIINQQLCINAYENYNHVTVRMICAGYLHVGGQDACQGDSGGPMVIGGVLHGVTSWGRGCAHPNYPGVWARVAQFVTWINSNI